MTIAPGRRLGQYEILAALGAGGMSEVYRAKDTKLDRVVAIKVLPKEVAENEERLARFELEASALAALNHPNIATLFEFGQEDDASYLVMELVPGQTLATRIAQGPLPLHQTLETFAQIAAGLQAAHEKGIVHRDLKPSNVMLKPDGGVKILDFGLAKALASSFKAQRPKPTATTIAGSVLGTPGYMSPEQSSGSAVDERTDIWAFGVCLFEALTGRRTFEGQAPEDVLAAVLSSDPPWDALPTETPAAIHWILRRCLRRKANHRLHHIADARLELVDPVLSTDTGMHGAASVPRGRVRRYAVNLTEAPMKPATSLVPQSALTISKDGQTLAYIGRTEEGNHLIKRALEHLRWEKIETNTHEMYCPIFSPDGDWLAYFDRTRASLYKVSMKGAPSRLLCRSENLTGAVWARDGFVYFSALPHVLARVAESGGDPEVLLEDEARASTLRLLDVLPERGSLLVAHGSQWRRSQIGVLSLHDRRITPLELWGTHAKYLPTGHIAFGGKGKLLAVRFDARTLKAGGDPVDISEEGMCPEGRTPDAWSFADDGTFVFATYPEQPAGQAKLVRIDRTGEEELLPFAAHAPTDWVTYSPDGRFLAAGIVDSSGDYDVWTYDLERGVANRLTQGPGYSSGPVWTTDGRYIVFCSDRNGRQNLFCQRADGSEPAIRLTDSPNTQAPGSVSPDGKVLFFFEWSLGGEACRILRMALEEGAQPEPLIDSRFDLRNPQISPDGRWLAYDSNETNTWEVYVTSYPDLSERWRVSVNGGEYPRWAAKTGDLFFSQSGSIHIVSIDPESGPSSDAPSMLFGDAAYERPNPVFAVSPDGKSVVQVSRPSDAERGSSQVVIVHGWFAEIQRVLPPDQ